MLPKETARHHRIKVIIIGVIIIPITLFLMLLIVGFVANVLERSQRISQGDYSLSGQKDTAPPAYEGPQRELIEGIGTQSYGAEEPALTIVQFADFACPYCQVSYTGLRQASLRYQDKVRVIFRDWPGHDHSIALAHAAYCAGEQNKFWEMHDKLYQNQAETFGADKNDIARLAIQLGIYNEQFQQCFDTEKYLSLIKKNTSDSQALHVRGTPTWFFNGIKVEGALSAAELERLIINFLE